MATTAFGTAWEAAVKLRGQQFDGLPPKKRPAVEGEAAKAEQQEAAESERREGCAKDGDSRWARVCVVEFSRRGIKPIRFRVNPRNDGTFTFSDPRGRDSGIAGTTGIWGTRPALRVVRPRSLTPTAFKVQAARYVGKERADEIVRQVVNHEFFRDVYDKCKIGNFGQE